MKQDKMTGVFSGRGKAGSAEIRSLGLGNDRGRGAQQYSHGGKMGQYWIYPASMPQVNLVGVSRAGPEQEHRIPQASLLSPAVPSLTPVAHWLFLLWNVPAPRILLENRGSSYSLSSLSSPICKWVCLGVAGKAPVGGQGPLAGNDIDTHVYPLSTCPCACVCMCNICLWASGELDHLHVPRMYQT